MFYNHNLLTDLPGVGRMNASKTVAKRRAERCMVALCRSRLSSTCLHYLQAANTRSQIANSNYSACIYYSRPAPPKFVLFRVRHVYHAYTDAYYTRSCWQPSLTLCLTVSVCPYKFGLKIIVLLFCHNCKNTISANVPVP